EVFTFRSRDAFERRHVDALLCSKPGCRSGRGSIGTEARGHRGPVDELFEVDLPFRYPRDPDGQSAGCAEGFGRRFRRQTAVVQLAADNFTDLVGQRWQPGSRQFLAANLKQEFAIHDQAVASGSVSWT